MMHILAESEVFTDRYFLGKPSWVPWTVGLVLALLVLSVLSYRGSTMPWHRKWIAILIRGIGIGLLAACLLEPMGVEERAKPQANAFAVMVDNSQSIRELWQARGRELNAQTTTSAKPDDWYRDLLSDKASWIRKLADDFRVRRYLFAESLEPIDSFEGIQQTGTHSSLVASLLSVKERYASTILVGKETRGVFPLAGVLLFSDGQATDKAKIELLREYGVPIYPVICNDIPGQRDITISDVSVRQTDFETAPVTLRATVKAIGFREPKVDVDLIDSEQKVVLTKSARLDSSSKTGLVEFQFRPKKSGAQGYRIVARDANVKRDSVQPNVDAASGNLESLEVTMLNNQRFQLVDRGRGPYRVLYLAGRPNWEFKFLSRALSEDQEVQMTALIRIAKKEPKFSFRDKRVDSANPLFSGFEDISDEEKEQFDQPVFVRLGLTESGQLKTGFPKDLEELFAYHAVIIDDLEHSFLSQEQQSMLRQFVTLRGGGLLALGGQESLRGKDFSTSVLSQILPVYGESNQTDPSDWTNNPNQESPQAIRVSLTREGWLQPFMRLSDNETGEKERLQKMPPFQVLNRTSQIKPGASILSEGKQGDESVPLLITQRYGRGRSAAFLLGDWWRWAMHRQNNEQPPLFQAWRQLVRWLISDVPRSIEIKSLPVEGSQRLQRVQVDVKGTDFQVVDNAMVMVDVQKPDGTELQFQLDASQETPGRYETTVICDQEGVYIGEASVSAPDGSQIGTAQGGWIYEPLAVELQSIGEDIEFLEDLAKTSGGQVIRIDRLDDFATTIPGDRVPIRDRRIYPLWHQSWVIVAALLCLCLEWGWRRRYGLA